VIARSVIALLLVLIVGGLTPLAHATPVDPTWVAGFWDNGDFDDVVLLVCATAAAVHPAPSLPDSGRVLVGTLSAPDPGAPPVHVTAPAATRAPPRI
jgi:hypothetical protein